MGFLVSDCSVGKFESQVGKKGSQVGKFDVQVGIEIFYTTERRVSPKSVIKILRILIAFSLINWY
jgi:hypothetical protein